jgi:hypothetical protein
LAANRPVFWAEFIPPNLKSEVPDPLQATCQLIATLNSASLLATCAYIDLNPIAAGIAVTPEKSPHTSVKSPVDHSVEQRAAQVKLETLQKISPYFSKVYCERGLWPFPIEDCWDPNGVGQAGMLQDISLMGYLQLIDWSSWLIRPGKVNLPQIVPSILNRPQTDATTWQATLEKLLGPNKQIGTYFGNSSRLNEVAAQRGTKYLTNVTGRSESTPATTTVTRLLPVFSRTCERDAALLERPCTSSLHLDALLKSVLSRNKSAATH